MTRLFPNHPKIRFSYPIHELVEPSIHLLNKYNILDHGTLIHHYGHTLNRKKIKDDYKINLYRELGKQKIAADPDSARPYFELGVHLLGSMASLKILKGSWLFIKGCSA
ncbi:MAG: hypothetical protein R3A13_03750 [Bdellovibrionota bacterium]